MSDSIVTRFIVGTEQGINTMLSIGPATAKEKYAGSVPDDELVAFINSNYNNVVLHAEMNSMSNQFLVVYSDGEPAGYAKITSKGHRPEIFDKKTAVRIADFDVLKKFNDIHVRKNLFEKCLSVCNMQQIVWICEYEGNPDLEFFKSYGFRKNTGITGSGELGLSPICLVKEKESPVLQNK
jgi:hypothetical protein